MVPVISDSCSGRSGGSGGFVPVVPVVSFRLFRVLVHAVVTCSGLRNVVVNSTEASSREQTSGSVIGKNLLEKANVQLNLVNMKVYDRTIYRLFI